MSYKNIIFCCKDCGIIITSKSALYGHGRCKSCSKKGTHHSKETKEKISLAHLGKILSEKTKRIISISTSGKNSVHWIDGRTIKQHYCKCCKKKINYKTALYKSCLCQTCSHKGKKLSIKTKEKMSKAKKGNKYCLGIKFSQKRKNQISKKHKGKKLSIKTKIKISKTLIKLFKNPKNHPAYVHGLALSKYSFKFNKDLKQKIRQRDNFTCQECGKNQNNNRRKLSIHHIDYNKENCKDNNLISLCDSCHLQTNYNRDYWYAYCKYIMDNYV